VSTLPDGRPVVAEIRFAADQITLTGAVPTDQDVVRLEAFAAGYTLVDAPMVDDLTVDPDAPADGGVRVVELNAANFVEDSSALSPEQAEQLVRVVTAMGDDPGLTLHVVGNTDLDGDPTRGLIVSQRRADSVVAYLVARGIDGTRLTSQPGGQDYPLSTAPNAEADALNRRTDLVFFGLLG
jgi:outer membrane protein OmpA-like peptidoglycan-associated protein